MEGKNVDGDEVEATPRSIRTQWVFTANAMRLVILLRDTRQNGHQLCNNHQYDIDTAFLISVKSARYPLQGVENTKDPMKHRSLYGFEQAAATKVICLNGSRSSVREPGNHRHSYLYMSMTC
uniref:AlNc14C376G11172 protein n=1 Tax=Albugo laibachii Nc14 TaxID=890382 RepID=F0WYB3_9STRA|nr:AlNc14C376G11172 [Albugo laibachii Nc14]|eukprot:CCA26465.1 AlNc14C376G11172 [Albugo laibachii Nc14]